MNSSPLSKRTRWLQTARLACAVAGITTLPAAASAQGFGLNEIGSCAVGRGFAVTGATCNDASVIFWNPAAAVDLPVGTMSLGGALIDVQGGFRQDTTLHRYAANVPTAKAPHFFLNSVNGRMAYGIGVYVPYGLTSQWNGDFPGRFEAIKTSLKTIYIQPNIAYALTPNWSVGGGPIIGHSDVELDQALDLSQQVAALIGGNPVTFGQLGIASGTEFATAQVKGSANAYGYNVGIHGKLGSAWTVGARYLSALQFNYDNAKATFQQVPTGLTLAAGNPIVPSGASAPLDAVVSSQFTGTGPLTSQGAQTSIKHPWQAQGGLGFTGFSNTTLSADIARIGWSSFQTLPLTFTGPASGSNRVLLEDYQDIWLYRFGAEYSMPTGSWQGIKLRGGYSYAQTPAPDVTVTPLLPDMPRQNASLGVGVPLSGGSVLDASYVHIGTPGRRGRVVERTSAAQTAEELNSGSYDLSANVFSLTLTTKF
jgi:long-chain fatty acid transport protein